MAASPALSIAILVHSLSDGGAQKRLVSLANGFVAQGHEVALLAVSGAVSGAGDGARLLDPRVATVVLDPGGRRRLMASFAGLGALRDYLRHTRPQVLLAGSNRVHVVAARAVRGQASPPLLVLRAARHPLRRRPWSTPWKRMRETILRPIERAALGKADLIIAVSAESADAIRALVRHPERVVAIPNPTITAGFREAVGQPAAHPWFDSAAAGGDPVVLGVGRLSPQKDFETLVEALAILNKARPAKLILLGEGRLRSAIEALVARRGLVERIALIGHVDGVAGWLARADLLVSSSLWEGSPGAIIEAFEAGLPVVATACPGGSVELLADGKGGALVPVRDPLAMAKAIATLLDRPRDRDTVRALARPYQDDGRAELAYLAAIAGAAADRQKTAAPD